MFLYKCVNCGGWIDFEPGSTITTCAFCGAKQEFPELAEARWEAFSKAEGASKTRRKKLKAKEADPLLRRAFLFLEDGDFEKAGRYCERVLDREPENAQAYLGKLMAELEICREEELSACLEPFDDNDNYKKILRYASPELATTMRTYNDYIRDRSEQDRKMILYNDAMAALKSAEEDTANADRQAAEANDLRTCYNCEALYRYCGKAYEEAAVKFGEIRGFGEADKLEDLCKRQAEMCGKRAEDLQKEFLYLSAKQHMAGFDKEDFIAAVNSLRKIPGYKDADALLPLCEKKIEAFEEAEEADRQEAQRAAEEEKLLALRKKKRRRAGICLAGAFVLLCVAGLLIRHFCFVLPERYRAAEETFAGGNYEAAIEAFEALGDYRDSAQRIDEVRMARNERDYALAEASLAEKKYGDALRRFSSLKSYRDSEERSEEARLQYYKNELIQAKVGDEILFGQFEQDNNTGNGKENIEWIVLERIDDIMLVISKYVLDYRKFNGYYGPEKNYWATSSLRAWLNETFYDIAFTEKEKSLIITTRVQPDQNPGCPNTKQGNATYDEVFFLSAKQAEKLFANNDARRCQPTLSALETRKKSFVKMDPPSFSGWWLRTMGYEYKSKDDQAVMASEVFDTGSISYWGDLPAIINGVRPAIWVQCPAKEAD